jgi:threonine/homoserine efflux transporter RhtA
VLSPWSVPEHKARKWMWIGLAVIAALQLYYVQEMIAAFVVFGVFFAIAAGVGLLVFVVDRASERALDWAEVRTPTAVRTARRGLSFLEIFTGKRAPAQNAHS